MSADGIGFRHDGDRAGGRVDAALRLGLRHALHAMPARLELELRVRAAPDDPQDDLLVAAELGRRFGDDFDLPARAFRVAGIHPAEASCEERRFVAARSGADFQEDVALVVGVLRQQHALQVRGKRAHLRRGRRVLLVGEGLHLRIARHLVGRGDVGFRERVLLVPRDHGLDVRALAGERPIAVHVAHDVLGRQGRVELGQAPGERFELVAQRRFHRGEGKARRRRAIYAIPFGAGETAREPVARGAPGYATSRGALMPSSGSW